MRLARVLALLLTAIAVVRFTPALAADAWIEVSSPMVTVMTASGEQNARRIAAQVEQIRMVLELNPLVRMGPLNKPLLVILARDNAAYTEIDPSNPTFVGQRAVGEARSFILFDLGTDVAPGSNGFRILLPYVGLVIEQNFQRRLPYWLERGLTTILQNAKIAGRAVTVGVPQATEIDLVTRLDRIPFSQLLKADNTAAAVVRRTQQFDAQSWALVEYLFASAPDGHHLSDVVDAVLRESTSEAALSKIAPLDELEAAYVNFARRPLDKWTVGTLTLDRAVDPSSFTVRPLPPVEAKSALAGYYLARNKTTDADAAIEDARKIDPESPALAEVVGLAALKRGLKGEARDAFERAIAKETTSYAPYFLVAKQRMDMRDIAILTEVRQQFAKAIDLNERFGPAYSSLGTVLLRQGKADEAVALCRLAVALQPHAFSPKSELANALLGAGKYAEALAIAQDALAMARTDADREPIRTLIASIPR